MGVFLGPLSKVLGSTTDILGGINLLSMEDYAPSTFLGSWVLVVSYLCYGFVFLINLFWKIMFLKLKRVYTYFNHANVQREMTFFS
jgi:hypothetical protein